MLISPRGLAAFKLCSFASHLTRDERMQSLARGQRPEWLSLWAQIKLQKTEPTDTSVCDERLCWLIWNPKGRLFICQCQGFKIRTKTRQKGKRTSVRLIFACESCKKLWKHLISLPLLLDDGSYVRDPTLPLKYQRNKSLNFFPLPPRLCQWHICQEFHNELWTLVFLITPYK